MANIFFKNLTLFFSNIKRRNSLIVLLGIILLIICIAFVQSIRPKRAKTFRSKAKIEAIHPIRSIPGGLDQRPSQEYIQLQEAHNQQQAEQAAKGGHSFIATIADSTKTQTSTDHNLSQGIQDNVHPIIEPLVKPLRETSEVEAVLARQTALLSEQKAEMLKQQVQSTMNQQINQLINTWLNQSASQEVVQSIDHTAFTTPTVDSEAVQLAKYLRSPIKAGSILRGVLLTSVSSDAPGPILAKITTGDLKGAKLIGTLSNLGERLLIKFNKISLPDHSNSVAIHAVAIDANEADVGLASYIDRHVMLRYGSLLAAALLEGYGRVFQRAGIAQPADEDVLQKIEKPEQEKHTRAQNQQSKTLKVNHSNQLMGALGQIGTQSSSALAAQFYKPATVYVYAGTGIGILLMEDLGSATPETSAGNHND